MKRKMLTTKRLLIYIIGLFFLALGAAFSIAANLGVSPVTALPYTFVLMSGISIGIMTVLANALFIVIQAILLKEMRWKNFSIQLLISLAFGSFMDLAIWVTSFLPTADSIWLIILYLALSLIIVATGLFFYFTANLPTMPYDTLTHVVATKWSLSFGKAKITCDLINVGVSLLLCFITLQSFGSIGIGTLIAAYGIGKIVGLLLQSYQLALKNRVFKQ